MSRERETKLCFKLRFQACLFEKGMLETLISWLKAYRFFCSCSCRRWKTHKHNKNLRYVSKLFHLLFQVFFISIYSFIVFFRVLLREEKLFRPLCKLESWKKAKAKKFVFGLQLSVLKVKGWTKTFASAHQGGANGRMKTFGLQLSTPKVGVECYLFVFSKWKGFWALSLEACRGMECNFITLDSSWSFLGLSLEAQEGLNVNSFTLGHKFLMPKVHGWVQFFLHLECVKFSKFELESSKRRRTQMFLCSAPNFWYRKFSMERKKIYVWHMVELLSLKL